MIELIDVRKEFNGRFVTDGVTLTVPEGSLTAIIGRSGEGKSVLLKQIMGLIPPTSGQIIIDTIDITQLPSDDLHTIYSKFGYVFQFAALLDSLTIFENIGITLLEQGKSPEEVLPLVLQKMALVHLPEETLHKYPQELSGGMRKKVGFARTLLQNPRYMLYDEPTSGLDPINSRVIHELMKELQTTCSITSVVISHDIEIFNYADYVALLDGGKIRYFGPSTTIWEEKNPYIYQFIRALPQGPMTVESGTRI